MRKTWILGLAALAALSVAGCVPQEREHTQPSGKRLYAENCAACHGPSGQGDGTLAKDLFMPPSDLTALSANNDGIFPRNYVVSTMDGYARGEHFSGAMPEFGVKLAGKDVIMETGDGVVTPTPAALVALADYIEGFQAE